MFRLRERGSVLIFILWTLTFLGILALALSRNVSQEVRAVKRLEDRVRSRALAHAGVQLIVEELQSDKTLAFDTLNESWRSQESMIKEAGSSLAENYPAETGDQEKMSSAAVDEDRKLPINKATAQILARFFESALGLDSTEAGDIAASIQDWRDNDDYRNQGGAEDDHYEALSPGYPCKDADFEVIEELLLVKGITPEMFLKIKDLLTVYGTGKININTASFHVLRAVGLSEDLAGKIVAYRAADDRKEGTRDDRMFQSVPSITQDLQSAMGLSPEEIEEISQVIGANLFDVKSNIFMIRSTGKAGGMSSSVQCHTDRKGTVLRWVEF